MKQDSEQTDTPKAAVMERARMLVRISERVGLPLDESGPAALNDAIAAARSEKAGSV